MTILKGDKGDRGDRGTSGNAGHQAPPGSRGPTGPKGTQGPAGASGQPCEAPHSAFSVGCRLTLHSVHHYQALVFHSVFVDLHRHSDMLQGRFHCCVARGSSSSTFNVHTFKHKQTCLHLMQNETERAVVSAWPGEHSVTQGQSLMRCG